MLYTAGVSRSTHTVARGGVLGGREYINRDTHGTTA